MCWSHHVSHDNAVGCQKSEGGKVGYILQSCVSEMQSLKGRAWRLGKGRNPADVTAATVVTQVYSAFLITCCRVAAP